MLAGSRTDSVLATVAGLVFVAGCNGPSTPHQIQNAHMDEMKETYSPSFTQMVDNAMLHDMSVTDIHFVPHTTELSGTGMARLDRMVEYLKTYGGTVRYETHQPDETLVAQRIEHVREYLNLSECDMSRVDVAHMLSGGRATTANKAIEIDLKGTAVQQQAAGGPGGQGSGSSASN